MFFTVAVDLGEGSFFEYSTESILQLLQAVQSFGNADIQKVEDEYEIPENLEIYFEEGEEYVYDEDAECFCWYDEEDDAWRWLDEESGEWLLVEEEESEEEAE